MLLQERAVRSFPTEEKGVAETTWRGMHLTATSIPCPPAQVGGGGRRTGPGTKGGVGGRCVGIWLYLLLSYSDLVDKVLLVL